MVLERKGKSHTYELAILMNKSDGKCHSVLGFQWWLICALYRLTINFSFPWTMSIEFHFLIWLIAFLFNFNRGGQFGWYITLVTILFKCANYWGIIVVIINLEKIAIWFKQHISISLLNLIIKVPLIKC